MNGFVVPVDAPTGKIRASQYHFCMAVYRRQCYFFLVFAGDGQQHPTAHEGFEHPLKIEKGFADRILPPQRHPLYPNLTDHPTP